MQFTELSLVVGRDSTVFKEQLARILTLTRSIRLNLLIQACSQHLYRRILKEESGSPEALKKLQEQLRQNPYEAKVMMEAACYVVLQTDKKGAGGRGGALKEIVP